MFALRNMAALFQLLPPSDNKILLTAIGLQKSAVDSDAWLATDRANIQAAYEVHELLCGVPSIDLKCIYSIELKTDWLIKVSEYWDIISVQADALGDGTVVGASAMAASLFRTIVH
jgi:hypothetical protein